MEVGPKSKAEKMKKKKIMVVDDDREFLEELKETLSLSGYDAAVFSNGATALKMVRKIKPDIILLDLKMKGKNGFQVADELKRSAETAHIPIIAMTAFYTEKEHTILMDMCGIQTCLIKPFSSLDVISKIEDALKERG